VPPLHAAPPPGRSPRRHQLDPLNMCAMKIFKERVYGAARDRARNCLLRLVRRDREGEAVDAGQVKAVVQVFVQMGLGTLENYEKDFEAALLQETSEFFSRKAQEWIVDDSCPEYLEKAEEYLVKEEDRVAR